MEGGRKGKRGEGGLACVQGLLLPGLGEGWVGWDSESSCSQVRSGKDFAAQHIFFSSYPNDFQSDPRSHSEPLLKSLRLLKFSDIINSS